ncbi:MAG: hypothetical protein JW874_00605 [Spirochaetales bacterium]|nr:hypothetical protein [Spirochaetales bacterium]
MKKYCIFILFIFLAVGCYASFNDYYFFHSPVFISGRIVALSYSVYSDALPGWYKSGTLLIDIVSGTQLQFSPRYGRIYTAGRGNHFFIVNTKTIMLLEPEDSPLIRIVYSLDLATDLEISDFKAGMNNMLTFSVSNFGYRREISIDTDSGLVLDEKESDGPGIRRGNPEGMLDPGRSFRLFDDETCSYQIKNDIIWKINLEDGSEEEILPALVLGNDILIPEFGSVLDETYRINKTENLSFTELQKHAADYLEKGEMPPDVSLPVPDTQNTRLTIRFQSEWQNYLLLTGEDGSEEIVLPRIMISGP